MLDYVCLKKGFFELSLQSTGSHVIMPEIGDSLSILDVLVYCIRGGEAVFWLFDSNIVSR